MNAELLAAAREHGVNVDGLTEREVALCVAVRCGVDIQQPMRLGSSIRIADADVEHLVRRALIVARETAVADEREQAIVADTLSATESVRWLRGYHIRCTFDDLKEARSSGRLPCVWIDGAARYRIQDLDVLARQWSVQ